MGLRISRLYVLAGILIISCGTFSCKKEKIAEDARIEAPVRTYMVTARIDRKGTNSGSEATGVLKGSYDEQTKLLVYSLEYEHIVPYLITLRSGAKGSSGEMIKEIYKSDGTLLSKQPVSGSLKLSPIQERNLLKGLWFVTIGTAAMSPEVSGMLTLKQK